MNAAPREDFQTPLNSATVQEVTGASLDKGFMSCELRGVGG